MTVQSPTFRLTVAAFMEGYSQRLAKRINSELQRRGEDHNDLAHALRVNPRTAERWVSGSTEPQRRHRKAIADYLSVPIEELWPDLEAEGKALRDQLNRLERKLDALLRHSSIDPATFDEDGAADIEAAAAASTALLGGKVEAKPRAKPAPARRRRAS